MLADLERFKVLEGVELQGRHVTSALSVVVLAAHQVRKNPAKKTIPRDTWAERMLHFDSRPAQLMPGPIRRVFKSVPAIRQASNQPGLLRLFETLPGIPKGAVLRCDLLASHVVAGDVFWVFCLFTNDVSGIHTSSLPANNLIICSRGDYCALSSLHTLHATDVIWINDAGSDAGPSNVEGGRYVGTIEHPDPSSKVGATSCGACGALVEQPQKNIISWQRVRGLREKRHSTQRKVASSSRH